MTGAAENGRQPQTLAEMQGYIERHGYLSWLGAEFEEVDEGRVVMTIPYREELTNPDPDSERTLQGGILATLIDTSAAFALRTTFEDPTAASLTTTDLNTRYLRPATDDITAETEVVRAGTSVGVTDTTVTSTAPDGERTEVAVGGTTYRLFKE